jgi:hypothetical protein
MRVMIVELAHRLFEDTNERIAVGGRGRARRKGPAGRVPVRLFQIEVRVLLAYEVAEGREIGGALLR